MSSPSWLLDDPDTLRLVAALAVTSVLRPSALAVALGLPPGHLDAAAKALVLPGYTRVGRYDGVGMRYHLTWRGRRTFLQQLSVFEHTGP